MRKKKLLYLSLIVIVIAILSFSSLAWFNAADDITNTFYVASSDDGTADEIFSVDVWENTPDEEKDQDGYEYKDILPGSELKKEVYAENTGYYSQYVRMVVTVTNADAWIAALGNGYDLGTMFLGHDETKWVRLDAGVYDGTENTYTMTYYLKDILDAGESVCLFKTVKIPTELDQNDMVFIGGSFELTIRADAIQTENLGEGVDTAQEAFAAANWGNPADTAPVNP